LESLLLGKASGDVVFYFTIQISFVKDWGQALDIWILKDCTWGRERRIGRNPWGRTYVKNRGQCTEGGRTKAINEMME